MTVRRFALAILLTSTFPAAAFAQSTPRFVAGGTLGFARTWGDESMLGSGALTEARAGLNLTPVTQLEAVVTYVPFERHFESSGVSTEGRSIFTGLVLKQEFTRGTVRPFVLAGYGLNHHRGTRTDPFFTGTTTTTDHGFLGGGGFVVRRGSWEIGPEGRMHMFFVDSSGGTWLILSGGIRASVRF